MLPVQGAQRWVPGLGTEIPMPTDKEKRKIKAQDNQAQRAN